MPGNQMKRNNSRWSGGGGGGGRDNRRNPGMPQRLAASGMISPWENGLAPGQMPQSLMSGYQPAMTNTMMVSNMIRNEQSGYADSYPPQNKRRRMDMMGNFDDHHSGRGLLPAPIAPLMGSAPQHFTSSRSSDIQQRLGPWVPPKPETSNRGSTAFYTNQRNNNNNNVQGGARRPPPKRLTNRNRGKPRDKRDQSKDNNKRHPTKNVNDVKKESAKTTDDDPSSESQSAIKPTDENVDTEKSTSKPTKDDGAEPKEQTKVVDNYPVEALYCHICDLKPFTTRRGFIRHLDGISHKRMSNTFYSRHEAIKSLLDVSAQLVEMRRKDKTIRSADKKTPPGKLAEQTLLKAYLKPNNCCGKSFRAHYDFHEHRLTLAHLKNMHEKGQAETTPTGTIQDLDLDHASIESLDKLVLEAKIKNEECPLSHENIPPYDPSYAFGLQFVDKTTRYKCRACKTPSLVSLEQHCQSIEHYEVIVKQLNEQEQKKREKEQQEEEERKKALEKEQEENEPTVVAQKEAEPVEEDAEKIFNAYLKEEDQMIILDEDEPETIDEELHDDIMDEMAEIGNTIDEYDDTKYDPEEALKEGEEEEEPVAQDTVVEEAVEPVIEQAEDLDEQEDEVMTPRRSGRAGRVRNRNL